MGRGGGEGRGGEGARDRSTGRSSIDPFRVRTRATRPRGGRTIDDRASRGDGPDGGASARASALVRHRESTPGHLPREDLRDGGERRGEGQDGGSRAEARVSSARTTDARDGWLFKTRSARDAPCSDRIRRGRTPPPRPRARSAPRARGVASTASRCASRVWSRRPTRRARFSTQPCGPALFWLALASGRMKPQPLC